MNVKVEILHAATEESVGFLNNAPGMPEEFGTVREARNAISEFIEANPNTATSLAFVVEYVNGDHVGVVYFEGYWKYEL